MVSYGWCMFYNVHDAEWIILLTLKYIYIMEKIVGFLKDGWDIKLYNDVKSIDGVRRVRVGFRASKNGKIKKGDKLGYKAAQDAVDALIETIEEAE